MLTSLHCQRTRPGVPDASGRSTPEPIPGDTFTLSCNDALTAIGVLDRSGPRLFLAGRDLEAIAQGADTPDVRTDLGNCFRFLGQPQKALEQYAIAQKQNPQHENSLFNQISLYGDLLHDKDVKDTMKKVVKRAVKEAVKDAVHEAQDAQPAR